MVAVFMFQNQLKQFQILKWKPFFQYWQNTIIYFSTLYNYYANSNMFNQDEEDCHKPICKESPLGRLRTNLHDTKTHHACPLDRQQLGQYSWSLMHTFAAYYPQKPTDEEKKIMSGWLQGFKYMYPCTHCRGHFQKDYDKDPPSLNNQKELSLWVCRQHNYVNKILGKPQYSCDYEGLMKRWKTGCDFDSY